ncbi:MAG TPA: hypothetical protein VHB21_00400, partial [Minicystis sp.]|nr:hypothetical protein [Minicystis sp.]
LELRAYELEAFLAAVDRFARGGDEDDDDLVELGGSFVRNLRHNTLGRTHDAPADDARLRRILTRERRAMEPALREQWKRRWNELTGVHAAAFSPTPDEVKAAIRFQLRDPPTGGADVDATDPAAVAAREAAEGQLRLRRIDEIAALDPTYPRDFARGVVLFDMGRYPQAVEAFRTHLTKRPDGPWTLRARNHLLAAIDRAKKEP